MTGLSVDGAQSLASARSAVSGFYVTDVASGSLPIYVRGQIQQQKAGITLKQNLIGLDFTGRLISHKDYIEVRGEIKDISGKERAISAGFALPMDAIGWQWWDTIQGKRVVEAGEVYKHIRNCGAGETGEISRYPFSAIENGKMGISYAVRMDQPRIFVMEYDAKERLFRLRFDLGLSPETRKFPSKASFSFIIYKHDPEWGFRSAARRYYDFYPQFFAKRVKKEGGWICVWPGQLSHDAPDPRDFGWQYALYTWAAEQIEFCRKNGWYALAYSEPSMQHVPAGPAGEKAKYEDCVAALKRSADPSNEPDEHLWWKSVADTLGLPLTALLRERSQSILRSTLWDENGKIRMSLAPKIDGPYSGAFVPVNTDPEIPGGINAFYMKWLLEPSFSIAAKPGLGCDGIYLDSYDAWGSSTSLNYRKEHFQYADIPLTFGRDTCKPAIFSDFSAYEFTKQIAGRFRREDRYILSNWFHKFTFFPCHMWDIIGSEGAMRDDIMGRTIGYKKPYCDLFVAEDWEEYKKKSINGAHPGETYEGYIKRHMLYAVFPGRAVMDNEGRQIHRKYVPIIRVLAKAGWEPVTYARPSDPSIYAERFGPGKGGLFFSVHNKSIERKEFTLEVDMRNLGFRSRLSDLKDLVNDSPIPFTQTGRMVKITMSLDGKDTTALSLRYRSSRVVPRS